MGRSQNKGVTPRSRMRKVHTSFLVSGGHGPAGPTRRPHVFGGIRYGTRHPNRSLGSQLLDGLIRWDWSRPLFPAILLFQPNPKYQGWCLKQRLLDVPTYLLSTSQIHCTEVEGNLFHCCQVKNDDQWVYHGKNLAYINPKCTPQPVRGGVKASPFSPSHTLLTPRPTTLHSFLSPPNPLWSSR